MLRLARAAAAITLALTVGACGDASDTPDEDAVSEPSDTQVDDTSSPPESEPTGLYIAHVTRSTAAGADGCLDSARPAWRPNSKETTQRVCGVQGDAETWFSIDPSTAYAATVSDASASVPDEAASGGWVVEISLDDESAQRFSQLATKLLAMPAPDPIALIVGGRVVSAPIPTPGLENLTTLQVAGDFTRDEAESIAADLGAQQ